MKSLRRLMFLAIYSLLSLMILNSAGFGAEAPLRIGLVLSTTGQWSSLGGPAKDGAFLAAEKFNAAGGIKGQKVELVFEDDEGDPAKAASLLRKLTTQDNVCTVFGTSTTAASRAMAEVADNLKITMVAPVPTRAVVEGRRYVFHSAYPIDLAAEFLGQYMTEKLNWKRVAILNDTSEYGTTFAEHVEKWLKGRGIETFSEKFAPNARDLTPTWLKIAERKPDGLLLAAAAMDASAIAMKNRRQLGLKIPVLAGGALSSMRFAQLAGDAAEGTLFQSGFGYDRPREGEKKMLSAMAGKTAGGPPSTLFALGWDSTNLLLQAMQGAGCNRDGILKGLENIKGFQGASGIFNFSPTDHNGHSAKNSTIVKFEKDKFFHIFSY